MMISSELSEVPFTICHKIGDASGGFLTACLVLSCLSLLTQDNESFINKDNPAVIRKPNEEKSVMLHCCTTRMLCGDNK